MGEDRILLPKNGLPEFGIGMKILLHLPKNGMSQQLSTPQDHSVILRWWLGAQICMPAQVLVLYHVQIMSMQTYKDLDNYYGWISRLKKVR